MLYLNKARHLALSAYLIDVQLCQYASCQYGDIQVQSSELSKFSIVVIDIA